MEMFEIWENVKAAAKSPFTYMAIGATAGVLAGTIFLTSQIDSNSNDDYSAEGLYIKNLGNVTNTIDATKGRGFTTLVEGDNGTTTKYFAKGSFGDIENIDSVYVDSDFEKKMHKPGSYGNPEILNESKDILEDIQSTVSNKNSDDRDDYINNVVDEMKGKF